MIIAVDFDGCLCQNKWPDIGEPNAPLIALLDGRRKNGDKIILWTCREGQMLSAALLWCMRQGLEFDAVNDNLEEMKEKFGNNCRKVAADVYIDDRAMRIEAERFMWPMQNETEEAERKPGLLERIAARIGRRRTHGAK